jgi:uncharacterized protein (DUF1697 family)
MSDNSATTYIAMLRGINVSGKNMIKMPALVKAMEALGLGHVRSYIQSGNLIFETTPMVEQQLGQFIHEQIKKEFGFAVPVLIITPEKLMSVKENNPFLKRNAIDFSQLHVTFLQKEPDPDKVRKIDAEKYLPDEFVIDEKSVYLYCQSGYGKTKLHNGFFESKLKQDATTRNWNTVNKLIEMAESGR